MNKTRVLWVAVVISAGAVVGQPVAAQMYVYPDKGQSAEQEEKDKMACHEWAMRQTGVNPAEPAQTYSPPEQPRGFGALGGAAVGSAAGAIGGAIAGAAGKGAAIGAAVGGFLGILRRRREVQNQYATQQQEIAQHQAALGQYDRAFSTCLSGKGYTVSQ